MIKVHRQYHSPTKSTERNPYRKTYSRQKVNKFTAFYGIRKFITAFAWICNFTL